MGVSIDLHVYDLGAIQQQIRNIAESIECPEGRTADYFIENILPEFGFTADDKYITLWNEYYEGYNSGSELMSAVDMYFGTEDTYLDGYGYVGNVNAYEVLEKLDIEPIRVSEDEDY